MEIRPTFDPYAELGLKREATPHQIKAHYRRRSQVTHPDNKQTGSAAAFGVTKLAYDVLKDPKRREKFDRTGIIDDDNPDNIRVAAIQVIERFVGAAITDFLNAGYDDRPGPDGVAVGFSAEKDPRTSDLLGEIRAKIEKELADGHRGIKVGTAAIAFFRDLSSRFSVLRFSAADEDPEANFLARSVFTQVAVNEVTVKGLVDAVKVREAALEMLKKFSFRSGSIPAASTETKPSTMPALEQPAADAREHLATVPQ